MPFRLKQLLAGAFIVAVTIMVPVALFAFVAFFPVISCHGGGAGAKCGEVTMMASLPLALLLSPFDVIAMIFTCKGLTRWIWPRNAAASAL